MIALSEYMGIINDNTYELRIGAENNNRIELWKGGNKLNEKAGEYLGMCHFEILIFVSYYYFPFADNHQGKT